MFLQWKKHPVVITAGYIIGFPNDTRESILHDVDVIKRELPIDLIYFTNLTPLPGSEDHQRLSREGVWMDPDLNKYDLNHRVTHHPRMSDAEWDRVYAEVWHHFYSWDHMETIFRRMRALGSNKRKMTLNRLLWYRDFHALYGVHPLEGGYLRVKPRKDRRHGMERENPLLFYPKFVAVESTRLLVMFAHYLKAKRLLKRVLADPNGMQYRDVAITPPGLEELSLSLYAETRGTADEIAKRRRQDEVIRAAQAKSKLPEEEALDAAE
jgi:hypothetical protein